MKAEDEIAEESRQHEKLEKASDEANENPQRFSDGFGIARSGIGDLSINPKHLEDFGLV